MKNLKDKLHSNVNAKVSDQITEEDWNKIDWQTHIKIIEIIYWRVLTNIQGKLNEKS